MNIFISDFFLDVVNGGAEKYDNVIIEHFKIEHVYPCSSLSVDIIQNIIDMNRNKPINMFISNFAHLSLEVIDFISRSSINYFIIEHDYKFYTQRHVTQFRNNNYIVPKESINPILLSFYKNAKSVIVQTTLQEQIFKDNLNLDNLYNLKGSLYSEEELKLLDKYQSDYISKSIVKTPACVLQSNNYNKGTDLSSKYCRDNNIEFDLIEGESFEEFLEILCDYESLVYIPRILESCSRNVIEAKIIGLSVITKNTPIALESDFLENRDKIEYLRKIRNDLFHFIGENLSESNK